MPFGPARLWGVLRSCIMAACVALAGVAAAQPTASVVLGHGGAVVADAWNPIQIVTRNAGPLEFEILLDQGSLREGEIPFRYRAELAGGTGLATFTDDVYLPAWRSLQWRLSDATSLLASGSLAARELDARPLHLVVSRRPGIWRGLYAEGARVLERNGTDLPARAAAYDAVATVLVDGSTAPPTPESILAAAATGATVVLVGELPAGYADVALLAGPGSVAYGNGRVVRSSADAAGEHVAASAAVDPDIARDSLADALQLEPPQTFGTGPILLFAGAYVLVALLAIRFGRLPGVAAAIAMGFVASWAAWGALRPDATELRASATVEIGSGGIARRATVSRLLTLPAGELAVPGPAALMGRRPAVATPGELVVPLQRWGAAVVASAPSLADQRLAWSDGALENRSGGALSDVYVVGSGPQGRLATGASMRPAQTEDALLPPAYDGLLAFLPTGTALARSGHDVIVALADAREP